MPDPNITLTAIETHSAALEGAMKRHSANAGRCKVWSLAIIAGVMVFAGGKAQRGALPWVAGMVVLLALADACAVVMARACTDAYHAFMRKLPLNGGNAMKAEECFILPAPEPTWRQAGEVFAAMVRSRCCLFTGRCWRWWWLFMCRCRGMVSGENQPVSCRRRLRRRDVRLGVDAGRVGDAGAAAAGQAPAVPVAAGANPAQRRRPNPRR